MIIFLTLWVYVNMCLLKISSEQSKWVSRIPHFFLLWRKLCWLAFEELLSSCPRLLTVMGQTGFSLLPPTWSRSYEVIVGAVGCPPPPPFKMINSASSSLEMFLRTWDMFTLIFSLSLLAISNMPLSIWGQFGPLSFSSTDAALLAEWTQTSPAVGQQVALATLPFFYPDNCLGIMTYQMQQYLHHLYMYKCCPLCNP